ncbi:MAG: flagellar protein FlaG [Zetaproteobacteria bacterium]|nr:flagellar protein FlaG [Zetaproteobacteria bacterium]
MPISPAQASVVSATIPNVTPGTPGNVSAGNVASNSGAAQILKVNEEAGNRALLSPDAEVNRASMQRVADAANAVLPSAMSDKIGFQVDSRNGQLVVQVVDKANAQIVREFPSKEIRDLQAALSDFVGLVLNKVA